MFSFFKKKDTAVTNLSLLVNTDMHSHILPGIDDGSPDIETSIELIKGLYKLGIRETIATPHIIGDLYRNTPETINAALDKLKVAVADAAIDIKIFAAAEYMIDDNFYNLVMTKSPLLTIKDKIILTEQAYIAPSDYLGEIAFELVTEGYKPIMAHPERYFYYHKDYENYELLINSGFTLQVNLLSLTGYYGKPIAKAAKHILDHGLAEYVGTDMHHMKHLNTLLDKSNLNLLNKYLEKKQYNVFPG
jgi:tyrosine-protein phosphatase YwqE